MLFKPNAQYSGQVSYGATSCCGKQRKSVAAQGNTELGKCDFLKVNPGPQLQSEGHCCFGFTCLSLLWKDSTGNNQHV